MIGFSGESKGSSYAFELDLYDDPNVEESRWNTKGRNIILFVIKKELGLDHWPRLTKEKIKS